MTTDEAAHHVRKHVTDFERYAQEARAQQKGLEQALRGVANLDVRTVPGQFNSLFPALCELNPEFHLAPATNLGDLYEAVVVARPQWFSPEVTEEAFWDILKHNDVAKIQYFTSLDQIDFITAHPDHETTGYKLHELLDWLKGKTSKSSLPKRAAQSTFIEARSVTHALSDAQRGDNWFDVEGEVALQHMPKVRGRKTSLQTRLQPSSELWSWWGIQNRTNAALREALKNLNFETNITFQVTLACLLQTELARREFTLDEIIKLIGRDTDARRSQESRQSLRREVWGNILALASMPVIGARNGTWREPAAKGEKRTAMPKEALISRDPLLVITGGKTTNDNEPPKKISLTAGEWLMPWLGNREMLSDFGDVLKFAQIPRGRTPGAWAACAGLALQQHWREEASRAEKKQVSRGKTEGPKVEVLKFRPFTRRELLMEMFRCDDDNSPTTILNDPKGRRTRAEEYWQGVIDQLKKMRVVGSYREVKTLEKMDVSDLNEAWLDQPLDIRPGDEILKDALAIYDAATQAKKRVQRSGRNARTRSVSDEQ